MKMGYFYSVTVNKVGKFLYMYTQTQFKKDTYLFDLVIGPKTAGCQQLDTSKKTCFPIS